MTELGGIAVTDATAVSATTPSTSISTSNPSTSTSTSTSTLTPNTSTVTAGQHLTLAVNEERKLLNKKRKQNSLSYIAGKLPGETQSEYKSRRIAEGIRASRISHGLPIKKKLKKSGKMSPRSLKSSDSETTGETMETECENTPGVSPTAATSALTNSEVHNTTTTKTTNQRTKNHIPETSPIETEVIALRKRVANLERELRAEKEKRAAAEKAAEKKGPDIPSTQQFRQTSNTPGISPEMLSAIESVVFSALRGLFPQVQLPDHSSQRERRQQQQRQQPEPRLQQQPQQQPRQKQQEQPRLQQQQQPRQQQQQQEQPRLQQQSRQQQQQQQQQPRQQQPRQQVQPQPQQQQQPNQQQRRQRGKGNRALPNLASQITPGVSYAAAARNSAPEPPRQHQKPAAPQATTTRTSTAPPRNAKKKTRKSRKEDNRGVLLIPATPESGAVLDEIKKLVDPRSVNVTRTVQFPSGAALIQCGTAAEATRLKDAAISSCHIKEKPRPAFLPEFRIHNVDVDTTVEELQADLSKQLGHTASEIRFVPYKDAARSKRKLAVCYAERQLHAAASKRRNIRVGWISCRIDATTLLPRCRKCRLLGHVEKHCSGAERAPPTAKEPCIDCRSYNQRIQLARLPKGMRRNENHETNHASCPTKQTLMTKYQRNQLRSAPSEVNTHQVEMETTTDSTEEVSLSQPNDSATGSTN